MMHKNCFYLFLPLCLLALLSSCTAPKEVIYFQDIDQLKQEAIAREYEVKIRPDDLLAIVVTGKDQEVVLPFNQPMASYQIGESYTQQRLVGYLVDPAGDIDFPFLGKLHVAGLTRTEVTELIKDRLSGEDLLKDPVVTVQFLNFKVSVMGEVARPGTFDITGDRVTLLEALSMAGDLTIYGRRDRVAVIREENGERTVRLPRPALLGHLRVALLLPSAERRCVRCPERHPHGLEPHQLQQLGECVAVGGLCAGLHRVAHRDDRPLTRGG